jgi:hypothetical protein
VNRGAAMFCGTVAVEGWAGQRGPDFGMISLAFPALEWNENFRVIQSIGVTRRLHSLTLGSVATLVLPAD